MLKKNYIMILALAVCLVTTLLISISTSRNPGTVASISQYDPWVDLNDDGVIDSTDLGILGAVWGSTGDPTRNVSITNWPVNTYGYLKVTMDHRNLFSFAGSFNVAPGETRVEAPLAILPEGCRSVTIGISSEGTGTGDVYVLIGFAPSYEHWFPIYDGTVPTTSTSSQPVAYKVVRTTDVISDILAIRINNPSGNSRMVYVGIEATN